ncbi:MAG: NADH-quinone oxidoreductase subunit J [Anaerolineales bacterium]
METTPELILFLIVGAVAIFAAVMMLISQNAVHSALFLVLNFACVAFLYLMLHASFLAMVQITVYAGAIMVLFLFVIMLLGAESLAPQRNPRFPWLPRVAVALVAVLFLIAGIGILESEVSATEIEPRDPLVQVINTVPGYDHVTVRLGDHTLSEELMFRDISEPEVLPPGDYTLSVQAADETDLTFGRVDVNDPAAELSVVGQVNAALTNEDLPAPSVELAEAEVTLEGGQDVALVLTEQLDGTYGFIVVPRDLDDVTLSQAGRVQLVNAYPEAGPVDMADITQADDEPRMVVEGIPFGAASEARTRRIGDYTYGIYPAGQVDAALLADADTTAFEIPRLARIEEDDFTDNTSILYVLSVPTMVNLEGQQPDLLHFVTDNRPMFGGPTSIGRLLYIEYMLPLQIVALLLLVAMIGAIVLTRDQVLPPRKRFPRRLANQPGNPIVGESAQD